MLCVNRRWEAIMRALALRYVIVESPTDLMNYHRIVGELKEKIQDEAVLLHFFSRTHIRVVINALVLPPMLPACRSIEVTHGNTLYKRDDDIISLTDPSLAPWLQIPHLQAVAFLQSRVAVKSSSGGSGEPSYQASVPPTLTYIHDHNSITSQNLRALTCLSHITQLRVSFPRPLIDFVGHVPNLEVLILDLTYGLVDRHYTTVAALKAGLFRKKKRLLILNTGPVQPTYFQTAVKKVCEQQKIMLERRIVYYDVDRTKYLFPDVSRVLSSVFQAFSGP